MNWTGCWKKKLFSGNGWRFSGQQAGRGFPAPPCPPTDPAAGWKFYLKLDFGGNKAHIEGGAGGEKEAGDAEE